MIGLDTNVVVRYFTHDDPRQTAAARKLILSLRPEDPAFLSFVVVVELVWVLQGSYHFPKDEVVSVIETLLRSQELTIERADVVWKALTKYRLSRADFADCLIDRCAHEAGCTHTVTFDREAAKSAGMKLLA